MRRRTVNPEKWVRIPPVTLLTFSPLYVIIEYMKKIKECLNNGFSYSCAEFKVTMVYNESLNTYAAAASLFDAESGEFQEPFVWGNIESEYPSLHPLPWLVTRYVGQHEWLTEELLECLLKVGPEVAPLLPGGHSALMDALQKSIYDYRVDVVRKKAKRRFFRRNEEKSAPKE